MTVDAPSDNTIEGGFVEFTYIGDDGVEYTDSAEMSSSARCV